MSRVRVAGDTSARPGGDASPAVDRPAVGLSTLLAEAADLLSGESSASRTFLGGLVLGAMVGAAVAGASFVRGRTSAGGRAPRPEGSASRR